MEQQRCYRHLTAQERRVIEKCLLENLSLTEIARRIGRDKSTVSRELRRNAVIFVPADEFVARRVLPRRADLLDEHSRTCPSREVSETVHVWTASTAQTHADSRSRRAAQERRRKTPETRKWVIEKLRLGWSPEQIAGRSKIDGPQSVSHEYVYALVYAERKRGKKLHHLLKRFCRRKQRFGVREYKRSNAQKNRVSIDERPAIVAKRSRVGDCEADLIVGYRQSGYILNVADRKSRLVELRRLDSKQMLETTKQLKVAFKKLRLVHTVTVDNGTEFNAHEELTKSTGVPVFFTHPYCSTERGSIENANGLVRYYLPKRTSFATLTQEHRDQISGALNNRPRKCLGYLTPREVPLKEVRLRTRSGVAIDR